MFLTANGLRRNRRNFLSVALIGAVFALFLIGGSGFGSVAWAADPPSSTQKDALSKVGTGAGTVGALAGYEQYVPVQTRIASVVRGLFGFIGILLVCIMIYAGFLYMTAGGNEEQITKAKKYIINAAIGLAIVMASYAITRFVILAVTTGKTGSGMNQEWGWSGSGGSYSDSN